MVRWKEALKQQLRMDESRLRFDSAHTLLQGGDFAGALKLFEDILREQPTNMLPLLYSAYALDGLGRGGEAAERLERVVHIFEAIQHPTPSEKEIASDALNAFGEKASRHGDAGRAIGYYSRALQLNPSNIESLLGLGRAHAKAGDFEAALGYFMEVAGKEGIGRGLTVEALHGVGEVHQKKGLTSDALGWFDRALEINPKHLKSLSASAEALMVLGDLAGARKRFAAALEVRKNYAPAVKGLRALEEFGK